MVGNRILALSRESCRGNPRSWRNSCTARAHREFNSVSDSVRERNIAEVRKTLERLFHRRTVAVSTEPHRDSSEFLLCIFRVEGTSPVTLLVPEKYLQSERDFDAYVFDIMMDNLYDVLRTVKRGQALLVPNEPGHGPEIIPWPDWTETE